MLSTAINEANQKIIERIKAARPHWVGVVAAKEAVPTLAQGKKLLHAGPPIVWHDMTGPMQGACIGACLFEGWAQDEKQALQLLESGQVEFIPCHSVNAVGPMGGITSANMPMIVVENVTHGNRAYCNLNEGIGKVMRFGAYGQEVLDRHRWMKESLGPALNDALKLFDNGIDLTALMAQAITMGDEFHQRNIAASALLLRTLSPKLILLDRSKAEMEKIFSFLSVTDQFFLNVAMAFCKSIMDSAAQIKEGTIVTAMTRNGKEFGIKVSGLGDQWFTAPVTSLKPLELAVRRWSLRRE